MNKRAMSKFLGVYWFLILVLISGGIVITVNNFYSHPYDVRGVEAHLLTEKVSDCLSNEGVLNKELFNKTNFNSNFSKNFLDKCSINFNDLEGKGQYYLKVDFYSLDDPSKVLFNISKGNSALVPYCEIQKNKKYKLLAKCDNSKLYSLSPFGKQYLIKITSIIKKTEKNVR